jgi:hypothetical protein
MGRFGRPSWKVGAALSSIVAPLGAGAVVGAPLLFSTPDAGTLAPVEAASAEVVQVEVLRPGGTFGEVIGESSLSVLDQQRLLMAFRERANPGRLRSGTEVSFRFRRGSDRVRGVDVAVSPDEVVRLDRGSLGWRSTLIRTPVWTDTLAVAGTIRTDLWTAVVMNPALRHMPTGDRMEVIHYLDRVFQWQLDFSRQIQPDDSYRLAFEREVRPDGSMRSGRILAAELVNAGKALHAVWFDLHGDGVGGYYDLEGESLQRAFIRAPLEYRRISSRYNPNRFHPILNTRRPHIGVDYAAASGTPVMATADGVVRLRGVNGGYGNSIEITHSNGYMTRYGHLSGYAQGLRVGGRVSQGEVIGYVGMTGLATGPHLHYEMHRNGSSIDPLSIDTDIPAGDPIPPEARERWLADLEVRVAVLERLQGDPVLRIAQVESSPSPARDAGRQ